MTVSIHEFVLWFRFSKTAYCIGSRSLYPRETGFSSLPPNPHLLLNSELHLSDGLQRYFPESEADRAFPSSSDVNSASTFPPLAITLPYHPQFNLLAKPLSLRTPLRLCHPDKISRLRGWDLGFVLVRIWLKFFSIVVGPSKRSRKFGQGRSLSHHL
jgi:hypothetical protein